MGAENILKKLQLINSDCIGAFCGYGVAVKDFKNSIIDWNVKKIRKAKKA